MAVTFLGGEMYVLINFANYNFDNNFIIMDEFLILLFVLFLLFCMGSDVVNMIALLKKISSLDLLDNN